MIPYPYYSLILGAVFALAGLWAIGAGVLGLVFGTVRAGNLLAVPVGVGHVALGLAGIRDYIDKEQRAQAQAARRQRPRQNP